MVEYLIRRYVAPPWIDRLDFSTLEMVPAHYVSEELEQRESDIVWRLRCAPGGDWFYIYILIEFQFSVLRFMAIRVLAYLMLRVALSQQVDEKFGILEPRHGALIAKASED